MVKPGDDSDKVAINGAKGRVFLACNKIKACRTYIIFCTKIVGTKNVPTRTFVGTKNGTLIFFARQNPQERVATEAVNEVATLSATAPVLDPTNLSEQAKAVADHHLIETAAVRALATAKPIHPYNASECHRRLRSRNNLSIRYTNKSHSLFKAF